MKEIFIKLTKKIKKNSVENDITHMLFNDFETELKINAVKEELNLMMFNSPDFSTDDMKFTNQLVEVLKDVKIEINTN